MPRDNPHVLVMGVGNLLWADEGFGVRCVEAFARRFAENEQLEILDGGTQGLALVPYVARATHLLLFDAVDCGASPGSLVLRRDGEVRGSVGAEKMSLHQAGMSDVLACAELMGRLPRHITLIGVQPVQLEDYGGSLTAPVRAQIEPAIAAAVAELARWRVAVGARDAADARGATVVPAGPIGLEHYESGRPSAEAACRTGDARVLTRARQELP
ncbi:MAG: HyaD/HybD family hydrogenase maturation endopeptidase [Steroidobacteraceae bacterium]|jgi:hydrogenase maturation protease